MKRILAIDGGGIRGLIPAYVCMKMEQLAGAPLHSMFDLIAGTSTGGIIALGLTAPPNGMLGEELVRFYRDHGESIFAKPRQRRSYLWRSKYSNKNLADLLGKTFGNLRIGDALSEVVIPAYDLRLRLPVYFSRTTAIQSQSNNHLMREVAIATSAAPTYFPPIKLQKMVCVDGGVVANNPSCLAIAEARRLWPDEELLVVSLGTGRFCRPIDFAEAEKWGAVKWASRVIDCVFDGTARATEDFLRSTMPHHLYHRIQFNLSELTESLDGASPRSLNALEQLGVAYVIENEQRLLELLSTLKGAKASGVPDKTHSLMSNIQNGVRKSVSISSPIFRRGVENKLEELHRAVKLWECGRIHVPVSDRGRFLVDLYGEAQHSVFSTRLKAFSGRFRKSSLPQEILEANRSAKAKGKTVRVFVFESADDVDGFDYSEMIRQDSAQIDVRIQMGSKLNSRQIEDFTIIDETTLGTTTFVGATDAEAEWTFGDSSIIRPYLQMRDELLRTSIPLSEFLSQQTSRSRLWLDHHMEDVVDENIDEYHSLCVRFFGTDVAPKDVVLETQKRSGGGIYVLKHSNQGQMTAVGIFAMFPVSRRGFQKLEADQLKGSSFTSRDVLAVEESHAIAYYLGAIAGLNVRAKAALRDFLKSCIRELSRQGVESIFARPVTSDGLRLLTELNFEGPHRQADVAMDSVCRKRLGAE